MSRSGMPEEARVPALKPRAGEGVGGGAAGVWTRTWEGRMSREQGKVDWGTVLATVLGAVGTALAFTGLFAALAGPVVETLQRL